MSMSKKKEIKTLKLKGHLEQGISYSLKKKQVNSLINNAFNFDKNGQLEECKYVFRSLHTAYFIQLQICDTKCPKIYRKYVLHTV